MAEKLSSLDHVSRIYKELFSTPYQTVLMIGKARVKLEPGSKVEFENTWGKEIVEVEEDGSFGVSEIHNVGWYDYKKYHKNQISVLLLTSGGKVCIVPKEKVK
jgi:hypothetical protein